MPGKNCIANYLKTYTLLTASEGPEYFDHCDIEGTTDFIFGNATVVWSPLLTKKEAKINTLKNIFGNWNLPVN